jgi:4-hydroxy-3-polyprenylbenzoate decarboxylase
MAYKSMADCVRDLERHGHLLRVKGVVDPDLEMAEIHRRVFDAKGPALLFERVKGSPFRAVSNIYGTPERTDFVFRHTLRRIQKLFEIKADPSKALKHPLRHLGVPFAALNALPKRSLLRAPVLHGTTTIGQLPQIKSWPLDGGAFVTLPQVYTEDPDKPGPMGANVGMYRIQLSGNQYIADKEIGLHYQLHRGIGIHHVKYNASDKPFRASIFVGGPPSHAFSAIMPMPEGLSELTIAGLLNGRRFRYCRHNGHTLSSDADFCITGIIKKGTKKPEGPFGDHLGYYSLAHDFPVMEVEKVYHRKDAIWHFTVVGRPPQEDSNFGYLIHKLVKSLTANEFPGVRQLNAVDAAGVHPLLLAIGSERYMPFRERRPEEILTQANRILGSGQTSLAKYLIIAAEGDDPALDAQNIPHFFQHVLERVDWRRDLHFQTKTTIDTLDYSGTGWNEGSKVAIACCGPKRRELANELPTDFSLPTGFSKPLLAQAGVLALEGPGHTQEPLAAQRLCEHLQHFELEKMPLIVLVDDSAFCALNIDNFLWVTFTRSNPSHDIYGVGSFVENKHWGCRGPIVIDARTKAQHAPPLATDPKVTARVDRLFAKGGELFGWG